MPNRRSDLVVSRLVATEEAADGGVAAGMGVSYQAFAIMDGRSPPPVAFEVDEA